jgi:hypothetical protein
MSSLITEFTKIVRNGILHVKWTAYSAVLPLYKLTDRFMINLNIPINTRERFRLTDFWATLYKTESKRSVLTQN